MNEVLTFISGELLISVHQVDNGSKLTVTVHANFKGARMVDESGRKYVVSGTYNEQKSDFSSGESTVKVVHFDRAITSGGKNNVILKDTYYIKIDADRNVTVIRDETHEFYCQ